MNEQSANDLLGRDQLNLLTVRLPLGRDLAWRAAERREPGGASRGPVGVLREDELVARAPWPADSRQRRPSLSRDVCSTRHRRDRHCAGRRWRPPELAAPRACAMARDTDGAARGRRRSIEPRHATSVGRPIKSAKPRLWDRCGVHHRFDPRVATGRRQGPREAGPTCRALRGAAGRLLGAGRHPRFGLTVTVADGAVSPEGESW
jgi:hypothetical protein